MWQDLYQVSDCFVCIDTYADSEKEIRIMIKQIGTLNIEIERRKIKNINIYVKPPNGDVLVTVPMSFQRRGFSFP